MTRMLLVLLSLVAAAHCSSADCRSDSDCGQGQCCAYVVGKYGTTSCQALGAPQDFCRPDAGAAPFIVSSPGGDSTPVQAHYMTCPCSNGLTCQRGVCAQGLPYGSEAHPAQVPRPY